MVAVVAEVVEVVDKVELFVDVDGVSVLIVCLVVEGVVACVVDFVVVEVVDVGFVVVGECEVLKVVVKRVDFVENDDDFVVEGEPVEGEELRV